MVAVMGRGRLPPQVLQSCRFLKVKGDRVAGFVQTLQPFQNENLQGSLGEDGLLIGPGQGLPLLFQALEKLLVQEYLGMNRLPQALRLCW